MSLGYPLTPDHLRLMFTPEFGMFIAPGCNGIRGAVTMGFIALIAGYIYRFRWYINALVVMAAILLGYLFNLVRLCLLVLYYAVALHFTSLQDKAENADYLIGAALFLIATLLLLEAVRRLGGDDRQTEVKVIPPNGIAVQGSVAGRRYAQLAAMGAMVLFGCAGLAQARVATRSTRAIAAAAGSRFPEHLGNYVLERSWSETMLGGEVIYVWGEYKPLGGGTPIAIGLAPALGWHDPLICHATRGEHPLWQGQLTVATADSAPVSFSSAFYNDGVTQYLEASTQCAGASCGEFATQRTHFGFIFSRPEPGTFLSQTPQRSIPILIRAEMVDMTIPADAARTELTSDLRTFLAPVSMNDLTQSGDR